MATVWKRLEKKTRDGYVAGIRRYLGVIRRRPEPGVRGPWKRRYSKWCGQATMEAPSKRCYPDYASCKKQGEYRRSCRQGTGRWPVQWKHHESVGWGSKSWGDLAQHWISTASAEDLDHISKLRVPRSFIDTVPRNRLHALRYRVAWHQYHMAHAVILLRHSLPMPPREAERAKHTPYHSTPVWYTALCRWAVQPNPSDSTLHSQVRYRPPMPNKKPPGRRRPARPPDERVDRLLLQPYSESNACAMLRLISAVQPPVQDKVQQYLATRMATAANPPPPPPPTPTREYKFRHFPHAVTVPS